MYARHGICWRIIVAMACSWGWDCSRFPTWMGDECLELGDGCMMWMWGRGSDEIFVHNIRASRPCNVFHHALVCWWTRIYIHSIKCGAAKDSFDNVWSGSSLVHDVLLLHHDDHISCLNATTNSSGHCTTTFRRRPVLGGGCFAHTFDVFYARSRREGRIGESGVCYKASCWIWLNWGDCKIIDSTHQSAPNFCFSIIYFWFHSIIIDSSYMTNYVHWDHCYDKLIA